jgi:hypothetical protein
MQEADAPGIVSEVRRVVVLHLLRRSEEEESMTYTPDEQEVRDYILGVTTTIKTTPFRPYNWSENLERKYPRLIRAMQFVACLSRGEALACLRDYRAGFDYSSEAVNHFGGCRAVLERASREHIRNVVRFARMI